MKKQTEAEDLFMYKHCSCLWDQHDRDLSKDQELNIRGFLEGGPCAAGFNCKVSESPAESEGQFDKKK